MAEATGAAVEAAAQAELQRAGLKPVAANVRFRGGELDLVMLDPNARGGPTLVFVEVRYRRSSAFGGGAASVDAGKRRKLVRAASLYLAQHPRYADLPCRFDVVEASGEAAKPILNWLRDAFRADEV
ncbi:YraN family protein [Pseudoxanthomonas composti]|uniref:YraN family protein n=1 Tax=Pseudoxanthomonas composti TaxID=2137479 RepID=UPI001F50543C|nr:YraN family protein [Pseudoxanthomonas composti]